MNDDDGADGDDDNDNDGAGNGVLWEMTFPIALMMVTVSSARPPRVLVTTGTNSTPAGSQVGSQLALVERMARGAGCLKEGLLL